MGKIMVKRAAKGAILGGQEERWTEFKRTYPKVAKALDLFRISQEQYERALGALYGPRLLTASSTTPPQRGPGEADGDVE